MDDMEYSECAKLFNYCHEARCFDASDESVHAELDNYIRCQPKKGEREILRLLLQFLFYATNK